MLTYLKTYGYRWLEGSIRRDLDAAGRGIWADLLALASISRRLGYIERSKGIPYTDKEISNKLNVPIKQLQQVIATCILEGRLASEQDGTLYIANWNKYQDYPLGTEADAKGHYTKPKDSDNGNHPKGMRNVVTGKYTGEMTRPKRSSGAFSDIND